MSLENPIYQSFLTISNLEIPFMPQSSSLYIVIGTSLHRNRNTITQERLFQGVNGVKELGS